MSNEQLTISKLNFWTPKRSRRLWKIQGRFCFGGFCGLKARLNSARGIAPGRRTFILRRRPERANHSVNKQRLSSSISYSFGMEPYFRCLSCPFRATMEKHKPFSQGVALGWHKLSLRDAMENTPSQKELMRYDANIINKLFHYQPLTNKIWKIIKKCHKSGYILEWAKPINPELKYPLFSFCLYSQQFSSPEHSSLFQWHIPTCYSQCPLLRPVYKVYFW